MEFKNVNKTHERIDGMEKVTGKAIYGSDVRMLNMLYAKGVYSEYAHAKILSIDKSKALALEGVADVVVAKDLPGSKTIGEVVSDQYVLADDKVRMYGDVVAVVAAETPEIAAEAVKLVKVEYEPLPALHDPRTAINNPTVVTDLFPTNVYCDYVASNGDIEKGFAESDLIFEQDYETSWQEHVYTEPEVVIGIPSIHDGAVTVYGCLQNLYMARESVCQCLNIPMSRVTIRQTVIGGSFGGKQESTVSIAVRAALLAVRTKRPIKYLLTREESVRETFKRHPFYMHMKIGVTKDGMLRAISGDFISDAGAYVNKAKGIMGKAITLGAGPYNSPSAYFYGRAVMTNNIHTGSYQGFGNPQGIFARECAMTEVAEKLGLSPYEFRRRNIMKTGDVNGTGQKMDWCRIGALDVLDAAAKEIDFENKYWKYSRENKGSVRRGVGISCSLRGNSVGTVIQDNGRVYIEVEEDGSVLVSIGLAEIGQGLLTTMKIMTAEALGCDISRITINDPDTSRAPLTGAALASRGTYLGGHAINDAAAKIHAIVSEALCEKYEIAPEEIHYYDDKVTFGETEMPFDKAVKLCYDSGRTAASVGNYKTPPLTWDGKTGHGDAFYMFTFSCAMVEVEVDMDTGKTEVLKSVAAHDVGRAINPQMAKGQIVGGLVGAQGWALTEDLGCKDGVIRNLNYDNYIIPTTMDVREVVPIIVENPDPRGPYGARSLGEPAFDPCGAAYVNAVNHAMGNGKHIRSLPANLEAVFFCEEEKQ
ncbi:xanthine dehydrogenase family protein molybdopterin-binding subunit [Anaerotruncus rubiinfantis]|uniref:xanthine dehydrogenase family protein molybdopterin-binding subunit n=2 Tax=Anaerotruncus rubiinfantis TaxID=1720200 RepID=UPI00189AEDA0|nr:xanthine dehydrogenase family protein molybdopterin-binding subunit [Anaerotruncus rubiinfantis]